MTKSYVETEYLEQDERMMHISKAMEKLTPHTRHILEECYIQRKKYQEVAEELNISVSAVRKHIVKALQVIREECDKKYIKHGVFILCIKRNINKYDTVKQ